MRSDLKEKTLRKFKGINASRAGSSFEAFGPADDQLIDISNFNITPSNFLEKRWGTQQVCAITVPTTPTSLRIIGTQRGSVIGISVNGQYNYVLVTDNNKVWKVDIATGAYAEYTYGPTSSLVNMQWTVEYGGTTQPYFCYGIRSGTGITSAMGGMVALDPNKNNMESSTGWQANTPVGTHITIFKDRAFVVNSNGSLELAGNETKVWYSDVGNPLGFGGAAMNNFNLDFGDGDYLVATVPFNDQLYCFKTRKTYVVGVEGAPADWSYRLASDRIGCVGRGTIKLIDGKMYFLSLEGVVRFDGAQAEIISENVKDLLETFRDYKLPANVMNVYASNWNNKYILWLPRTTDFTYYDNALVYDIATSTWSKWTLTNNVSVFGEAKFSDLTTDSLFLGSANTAGGKTNRLWRMSDTSWTDDGASYTCSFRTKKIDFGQPMSQKRLHSIGVTVKNDPGEVNAVARYQVDTTVDEALAYSTSLTPPPKFAVTNLKAIGCRSPGRYFTSSVSLINSTAYAAVYDITWLAEERGLESYSRPAGTKVEQIPTANIFTVGPSNNDRLTSGYVLR